LQTLHSAIAHDQEIRFQIGSEVAKRIDNIPRNGMGSCIDPFFTCCSGRSLNHLVRMTNLSLRVKIHPRS
jgi:hypothetical protein